MNPGVFLFHHLGKHGPGMVNRIPLAVFGINESGPIGFKQFEEPFRVLKSGREEFNEERDAGVTPELGSRQDAGFRPLGINPNECRGFRQPFPFPNGIQSHHGDPDGMPWETLVDFMVQPVVPAIVGAKLQGRFPVKRPTSPVNGFDAVLDLGRVD